MGRPTGNTQRNIPKSYKPDALQEHQLGFEDNLLRDAPDAMQAFSRQIAVLDLAGQVEAGKDDALWIHLQTAFLDVKSTKVGTCCAGYLVWELEGARELDELEAVVGQELLFIRWRELRVLVLLECPGAGDGTVFLEHSFVKRP